MSDEIRINRPPQQSAPAMMQQPASMPMQGEMMQPKTNSKMPWIILAVIVVVLVVLGVLFRDKLFNKGASNGAVLGVSTASSGYQAVFLTNGQVYFGKIASPDSDYVTLKDIYYLQVGPQQGSGTTPEAQQSISLVKLGNELHGPVDEMHISRTQILFYEDLKADGSVVKAIDAYKANPTGAPTPTK